MKYIIYIISLLASVAIFASCQGRYGVGDIYSRDGMKGIVVSTDDEGNPLALLSVDEAVNLDADSAAAWAASLGEGQWRLPSKEEFESMRKNRSIINNKLKNKKKQPIFVGDKFYWSSTACSESHVYALGPNGVQCYFRPNASPNYRARAYYSFEKNN